MIRSRTKAHVLRGMGGLIAAMAVLPWLASTSAQAATSTPGDCSTVPGGVPATASCAPLLGPNGKTTLTAFQGYIQTYLALNIGPNKQPYDPAVTSAGQIPVDAVDDSASSVDPNISVANARIQAYRIAAVRHLVLSTVDGLIATYTTGRSLGFLGEPGVNVLELNLALDRRTGSK